MSDLVSLLLCPKVTKFWTSVETLLISITSTCYVACCNGITNIISLLTLASCNIDQDHPEFDSKTLLTTQNIMGFALTTIITLGNNGSSEDLFKSFCKMLIEFLYKTLKFSQFAMNFASRPSSQRVHYITNWSPIGFRYFLYNYFSSTSL